MNKGEFVNAVRLKGGLTKRDAQAAIEAACLIIADEMVNGGEVAITGFMTFTSRLRDARMQRNPITEARVYKPAHRYPVVRFSPVLKKQLREGVEVYE